MGAFEDQLERMKKGGVGRGGKDWIEGDGLYEVEIIATQRKMGFNKTFTVRDKELFIANFRIISSTNPRHESGTSASWTCKDPSGDGGPDVKAFCIAACGLDPRKVKENDEAAQLQAAMLALAAMGEAEAFKRLDLPTDFFVGRRLRLETKTVKTKAQTDFTKHIWSPVEPTTEAPAAG